MKLSNFPVVDKSVLFMYNVGAIQNLIERHAKLDKAYEELAELEKKSEEMMTELEKRINADAEEQVLEERLRLAAEASKIKMETKLKEVQLEEQRKLLDKQGETDRRTVDFENKLAEERLRLEDERERNRTMESALLQEASARKAEEDRRATELLLKEKQMQQNQELEVERRKAELARVAAEAKAKADAERENEDVNLRAIEARGAEERKRLMEAITSVMEHLGRGGVALLANPRQLGTLLAAIVGVVAGGFIAREAATLARQILEARIGKPNLVRQTSRKRMLLLSPVALTQAVLGLLFAPFLFLYRFIGWALRRTRRALRKLFKKVFKKAKRARSSSSSSSSRKR